MLTTNWQKRQRLKIERYGRKSSNVHQVETRANSEKRPELSLNRPWKFILHKSAMKFPSQMEYVDANALVRTCR